ncbi:hypothetical protein HYS94_02955 [Candidatus Daviesbacteria bacterium]|nr:hypothetical protein [Candidatus Daviesbacteria bacterium]
MAIQQTKKQSDLEKRLRLLRLQVYGTGKKWEVRNEKMEKEMGSEKSNFSSQNLTSHVLHPTSNSQSFRTDITYLRQDLTKITMLAALAFGAQIILFFLMQNNLLKINIF